MQYGQILSRALSISWRHKYLWLLALFAGEGAASIGSSGAGGSGTSRGTANSMAAPDWAQVTAWITAHAALLWTIAIVVAVLCVVFFLVSAVANGALVKGSAEHDAERPFTLGLAWKAGLASFWPILQLKLFALLVVLTSLVVIGGLVAIAVIAGTGGATAASVGAAVAAALLVLVAIPFWVAFGVALLFAVRVVVLEGMGASMALGRGFRLIGQHLGRVALLWLVMLAVSIVAGMAAGIAIALLTVLVAVVVVGAAFAGGFVGAVILGVPFVLGWLAVVLTVGGAVSAFCSTYWTLAYTRLELESQPAGWASMSPPSPA
jgi:hypothetical protein